MKKFLLKLLTLLLVVSTALFVCTACKDGVDGKDGVTPTIEISEDGYWVINGEKTSVKASVDTEVSSEFSQGLEYSVSSDRSGYAVSGIGTCLDKVIKIPDTYKGKPVVEIAREAFGSLPVEGDIAIDEYIESVVIPNSVKSIGTFAFTGCAKLSNVTIGDNVEKIGAFAFAYCNSLNSVTLPSSVKYVGNDAFDDCDNLEKVYYTGDINGWVQIEFDDSIIYGIELYINNELVTSANITTATKINPGAFYGYDKLTSVTIGNSVISIGSSAFAGCDSLTSITFSDTSTWYRAYNYSDFENKTNGTETDVTNATNNVMYFKSYYDNYYWYKI